MRGEKLWRRHNVLLFRGLVLPPVHLPTGVSCCLSQVSCPLCFFSGSGEEGETDIVRWEHREWETNSCCSGSSAEAACLFFTPSTHSPVHLD